MYLYLFISYTQAIELWGLHIQLGYFLNKKCTYFAELCVVFFTLTCSDFSSEKI
jgi:hypothetical protein